MKKIQLIFSLISLLVFNTSCDEFYEMSVDLDVPAHESKLAATSFIKNNINDHIVLVSYSIGALEEEENSLLLNNARLHLSGNNENTSFSLGTQNGLYISDNPINFIPNKEYTLSISAPNYESITAVQTFPEEVRIDEASVDSQKVRIRFQDNPNQENYYLLELYRKNLQNGNYSTIYVDPFGETGYMSSTHNGVLFKDSSFNGEEFEMIVYHNLYFGGNETATLKAVLYHVTEDFYKYDRSLELSQMAEGNPFAEPVILHRNFQNGYGIFALMNKSEFEFTYN